MRKKKQVKTYRVTMERTIRETHEDEVKAVDEAGAIAIAQANADSMKPGWQYESTVDGWEEANVIEE